MAEHIVSDLIMKFVDTNNYTLDGESSTDLKLKKSRMTKGFDPGKMFELESFSFKTGLNGQDADGVDEKIDKKAAQQDKKMIAWAKKNHMDPAELSKSIKGSGFGKFRTGETFDPYPVDMRPVEFTRPIDRASPVLLQNCIYRRVFKSATLIKRRPTGGPNSGEVFLRFDFTDVLFNSVEWDNEDPVKETCEFVCRAVTIHYLPQLPSGQLGAPVQAFWSARPGMQRVSL